MVAREQITLPHGTAVITLFIREGIVMASDGLQVSEGLTGDPKNPFWQHREEAEPKVAVCNQSFLCGMAGTNPITLGKPINIEYHFQEWLPITNTKARFSVRDYAKAIQCKARATFQNMDAILKQDEFWKSEISTSNDFLKIAVAGYDGDAPQYCVVPIEFDRDKRQLFYADIQCTTPLWTRPSSVIRYVLSGHEQLMNQSLTHGTPEFARFTQLLPDARAATGSLFPHTPPSLKDIIAWAAVIIAMQGEFYPQQIGGTTRIGELVKGELPIVSPPLTLRLGQH